MADARLIIASVVVIATIGLSGCSKSISSRHDADAAERSPQVFSGRLTITGSSTVAPLVAEMAKRFEQRHPGVRIDVQTGGSGKGIADVRNGLAAIGMASRELKAGEADLTAHRIAVDGVGLIVHRSNRVDELTRQQVVDIYTGRINNWRDVGGVDLPVTVVHKAEGRATLEVFLRHFAIRNPDVKADVIVGDNEHGVKTVAGAKGAVGYVSIGTAESDARAGVPIRLLPIDGVAASTGNVAAGAFPLSRPLNLVMADSPDQVALAFVKFCQSKDVHDLIVAQYFVPLTD